LAPSRKPQPGETLWGAVPAWGRSRTGRGKLASLGPLPVTRLAAEAALDRSTMGRNLNPLERRGLVQIEVGNVDQREHVAYLTAAGEAAIEATLPYWRKAQDGSRPWRSLPPSASSPIGSTSRGRVSRFPREKQDDQKMQCASGRGARIATIAKCLRRQQS
jgi:DNA-binding MarR family transcriptional regulator